MNEEKKFDDEWNEIIEIELERIAKRSGLSHECEVSIVADQSLSFTKDGEAIDLMILPGNPPKLWVTWLFISRSLALRNTKVTLFRDRLERALERLPMMRRTLLNNIRPNNALILRKDYTRWLRTKLEVVEDLPLECFEFSYSVTVKEKDTGMSLTLHGDKVEELKSLKYQAIHRISRIVQTNEDIVRFREILKEMKEDKPKIDQLVQEQSIQKITLISLEGDQVKEKREYKP